MNEQDEAIAVVIGNQKRKELWEGCHNEDESRLIKMATNNLNHHYLSPKLTEEENFWIKYCSFAPDNTVFPYVYKFDDSAYLPYAFSIEYENASEWKEIDQHFATTYVDETINPKFQFNEIRKKAGIFYESNSDFPEEDYNLPRTSSVA